LSNFIENDDFIEILLETISSGRDFSFTPTGSSMLPMLDGTTDTVVLSKKPDVLKKYDVVLYKRKPDDSLVLHRIVKVMGDSLYCMCGDHQYCFDNNVSYDDIYAVVTSFTHRGKRYYNTSFAYVVYTRLILFKKNTRIFISKIYHKLFK